MRKLRKTNPNDIHMLVTIFMSTSLGTVGSGYFLKWTLTLFNRPDLLERLFVSLGSTLIYAAIAVGIFLLLIPESKLAFKKLIARRK